MNAVTLDAYAKINLGLRVWATRADGFHEIESVLQTINLADRVAIERKPNGKVRLDVQPDIGIDPSANLVYRAAELLREHEDVPFGADVRLSKRIPVGAGLGGGSSDAAAALVGLTRLWNLDLRRETLHDRALELGSDVPFFLHGGRCRVSGRGERVEPVGDEQRAAEGRFVLLVPPWSLSTAEVYRTFDQLSTRSLLDAPYRNDLEAAALELEPRLTAHRDWLMSQDVPFGLSGSGPVYFAVVATDADATQLTDAARTDVSGTVFICKPTPHGQALSSGVST